MPKKPAPIPATTDTFKPILPRDIAPIADAKLQGITLKTVKGEDFIEGYGIIFGGKDIDGDTFTKSTNLWSEYFKSGPVLYIHGVDDRIGKAPVGQIVEIKSDDVGVWIKAQLNKACAYVEKYIKPLAKMGVLGASTGAVKHLVERTPEREIKSWPIAELSLTVCPAEPRLFGSMEMKSLTQAFMDEPAIKESSVTIQNGGFDLPEHTSQLKACNENLKAMFAAHQAHYAAHQDHWKAVQTHMENHGNLLNKIAEMPGILAKFIRQEMDESHTKHRQALKAMMEEEQKKIEVDVKLLTDVREEIAKRYGR